VTCKRFISLLRQTSYMSRLQQKLANRRLEITTCKTVNIQLKKMFTLMHPKIKYFLNACNELLIQLQYAKKPCPSVTP